MPSVLQIIRLRQRRQRETLGLRRLGEISSYAALAISLILGGAVALAAAAYRNVQLPAASEIETIFGAPGSPVLPLTTISDRSGTLLLELLHPLAQDRQWVTLHPEQGVALKGHTQNAFLAAFNPTAEAGRRRRGPNLLQLFLGRQSTDQLSIAERLVETSMLLPPASSTALERAVLASRLSQTYSPTQILEWFLNSLHFGNLAYGLDAAARVYYDKPAVDLSLDESVYLAAIARLQSDGTGISAATIDQTVEEIFRRLQSGRLAGPGMIAYARQLVPRVPMPAAYSPRLNGAERYLLMRLRQALGDEVLQRSGMTLITTLDADLQTQLACASAALLRRREALPSDAETGACPASNLLPPQRPGELGGDPGFSSLGALVLDPARGELLALADETSATGSESQLISAHAAGAMLDPFIYLTAFSQGQGPGSMVLDIPRQVTLGEGATTVPMLPSSAGFHGPLSARMALARSLRSAALGVLEIAGAENVLRIVHQMGLTTLEQVGFDYTPQLALGSGEATLLDLGFAYGVFANRGRMAGVERRSAGDQNGSRSLDPIIFLSILDPFGNPLLPAPSAQRSVLSPELAYLIVDILSDENTRRGVWGSNSVFEIGRTVAVQATATDDNRSHWALGFTPERLVAVRVGEDQSQAETEAVRENLAAQLWHAIMRYSIADLPASGWARPAGIVDVEICTPSGLLPTRDCPQVMRELFIQGTEPTSLDDYYQSFLLNRRSGKLATVFTPLQEVEEVVFIIPPPEAQQWAEEVGLTLPPLEYDSFDKPGVADPQVMIAAPLGFSILRGNVVIRGTAEVDGMLYYRLQYGAGLNPTRWFQIGEDNPRGVYSGVLGIWDASSLNGLHTLLLQVVLPEGELRSHALLLTLDNQAPRLRISAPRAGEVIAYSPDLEISLRAALSDETRAGSVEFYINGKLVESAGRAPYAVTWRPAEPGDYEILCKGYDAAGNQTTSERITITVEQALGLAIPGSHFGKACAEGRFNLLASLGKQLGHRTEQTKAPGQHHVAKRHSEVRTQG